MILRSAIILALFTTPIYAASPSGPSNNDLPNGRETPGKFRPEATFDNLCPIAHTPALRSVSEAEKVLVYKNYGMAVVGGNFHIGYCASKAGCEVDHLVSLELGGANDIGNLWPEPYDGTIWNAHVKDKLENKLHALVCAKTITLQVAQDSIRLDWIAAYKQYVSPTP